MPSAGQHMQQATACKSSHFQHTWYAGYTHQAMSWLLWHGAVPTAAAGRTVSSSDMFSTTFRSQHTFAHLESSCSSCVLAEQAPHAACATVIVPDERQKHTTTNGASPVHTAAHTWCQTVAHVCWKCRHHMQQVQHITRAPQVLQHPPNRS